MITTSKLFGAEPAKLRPGYANFALEEPALKLVLLEGEPGQATVMDHLGVEVETTDQVDAATKRLTGDGFETFTEDNTTCCYAVQDKVWVHGPGQEPGGLHGEGRLSDLRHRQRRDGHTGDLLHAGAAARTAAKPDGCCS